MGLRPRRANKLGTASKAQRTDRSGRVYHSKREMMRAEELRLLERTGWIRDLREQPRFPLVMPDGTEIKIRSAKVPNGRRCVYHADFAYVVVQPHAGLERGEEVVEDVKGYDTEAARLRRAVVEAIYGIRILIVK